VCGIAGCLEMDGAPASEDVARAMGALLRHRGPDDRGVLSDGPCALAHQRLSVIDVSAAGRQPMVNEDGRYSIVFNGEIYNYLELRQRLIQSGHVFRSHTDTEVLLHLFEQMGPSCVNELNGMFAFAVWDRDARTLFLARDRMGIKPLYIARVGQRIAFASEIKALRPAIGAAWRMDEAALAEYLTFQLCLGKRTLFAGVEKVLPGEWVSAAANGSITRHQYWQTSYSIDGHHTAEYFEHQLLRLLEDAVRLQLRSDVPIGTYLSGGLDSSLVTMLASTLLGTPVRSYTGRFAEGPQYDESMYARIVSDAAGARPTVVTPTADDFVRMMPKIAWHLDEPAAGPGVFPQFCVSEAASKDVKVVLGGQGGDEVFAGYTRYLVAYLEECIRGGIAGTQHEDGRFVVTFDSILPNLPQLQGYEPMLRQFWGGGLFDPPEARYFRLIDRSEALREVLSPEARLHVQMANVEEEYRSLFLSGNAESYINRMTQFDQLTLLPALLQVEDRASMAYSLESRVPLLDHRIVELAASVPPRIKFAGGRAKHLLRHTARHIVPREVLERIDKKGFPVPLTEWMRAGAVREFVFDSLRDDKVVRSGLFDGRKTERLLAADGAYGRNLWGVLSLSLWIGQHFD
jgi:asparagine synthase (glutamine-hydrolysing)